MLALLVICLACLHVCSNAAPKGSLAFPSPPSENTTTTTVIPTKRSQSTVMERFSSTVVVETTTVTTTMASSTSVDVTVQDATTAAASETTTTLPESADNTTTEATTTKDQEMVTSPGTTQAVTEITPTQSLISATDGTPPQLVTEGVQSTTARQADANSPTVNATLQTDKRETPSMAPPTTGEVSHASKNDLFRGIWQWALGGAVSDQSLRNIWDGIETAPLNRPNICGLIVEQLSDTPIRPEAMQAFLLEHLAANTPTSALENSGLLIFQCCHIVETKSLFRFAQRRVPREQYALPKATDYDTCVALLDQLVKAVHKGELA